MSKLDDWIDEWVTPSDNVNHMKIKSEAKQAIKQLVLELIGDDELEQAPNGKTRPTKEGRNQLRRELKKKVEAL